MTEPTHSTGDEPADAHGDVPADGAAPDLDRDEDGVAPPDERVAAALRRLDALPEDEPAEHVAVYEDVHRTLQESLAEAADRDREDPRSPPGGGAGP